MYAVPDSMAPTQVWPRATARALAIAAAVTAILWPSASLMADVVPRRCSDTRASIERRWGATGAWRALPPYPVPRDASPTDSVGVWIERTMRADGIDELRRVSAEQTTLIRIDPSHCQPSQTIHRRTYDAAASAHAFTDAQLRALLRTQPSGVIYVWSPRMPWSVRGLFEAEATAASLGIAFTAVLADVDADATELRALGVDSTQTRTLDALDLVYRNATQHYPSALFYRDGALLDVAIPGYKDRETFRQIATEYLQGNRALRARTSGAAPTPKLWVDQTAQITTRSSTRMIRRLGFFFKPVPNSDLITYTANNASYLYNLRTGAEQRIPGNVDPVPTPDGRLLLRPGLKLHPMRALTTGDTIPVFTDPKLPDEYQTASIQQEANGIVRYRVITGWREGPRFRDYDVKYTSRGVYQSAVPVGAPFVPCGARSLSLPINAKSGTEFGVYDAGTRTSMILDVTPMQSCIDKFDLGFAAGKLSFSHDGRVVAFATSRVDTDARGLLLRPADLVYKDALLLYRSSGRLVAVSHNKGINALSFPEFQQDGSVMVLDQAGPGRKSDVLRIVKVR